MSRTREGKNPQPEMTPEQSMNETARQSVGGETDIDRQLGARGQTDYTPGRESWRDFPRRSTSRRERGEQYSQQRSAYRPQSRQAYGRYSGYDYENRGEERSRYRSTTPYNRREETREDFIGRPFESQRYGRSSGSGSQGRTGEYGQESQRRSRRDFEGEARQGRHSSDFQTDRSYDYDRENTGYRMQQQEFDEPYERETGGRYGHVGRNYERGFFDSGHGFDRDENEYEFEGRRDWDERGHGRRYMRCADIMTKDVTICSPQTVIRDVADKLDDDGVGSLPVVENGRVVGIITDRDIVCRVLADGRDSRTTPAAEAMSDEVITCTPDESVVEAIHKMGEHQIRRIPVCDTNGRLRGIIAMADVALEAENDRDIAQALEQISRPTPNRSRQV
ncbi:MAG TPA: CBS domain-containing protein [Blastocatellia bacterium]|nr:CBS domain-containing protein [Blastocatellia bacterium]